MADVTGKLQAVGRVIGMDMRPPYGVYVDGVEVARHKTESEAGALFDQLAGRVHPNAGANSAPIN